MGESVAKKILKRPVKPRKSIQPQKPRLAPPRPAPKRPAKPVERRIILQIPIKTMKLPFTCPRPLTIKAKPRKLIRPRLYSIEVQPAALTVPTISIKIETIAQADIKVPILEPATILKLITPPFRLKLKVPPDISIRPFVPFKTLSKLKVSEPIVRSPYVPALRPHLRPISIKSVGKRLPKIQAILMASGEVRKSIEAKRVAVREEGEYEGLNLLEWLLDEESRKYGGLGGVGAEGLVCILVDKYRGFHEFVKLLCAKVWRIKSGGLPSVAHRGYGEELIWHGLEEDVIELNHGAIEKESTKEELKSKSLESRMKFLLIPVERKDFEKAWQTLTDLKHELEPYLKHAKLLAYRLGEVDEDLLGRLLKSAFGFVEVDVHTNKIGHYSLELEGKFYRELEKAIKWVRRNVSAPYQPEPGDEQGQSESWLHWALKHLTYQHLILNEGINEERIKSEVELGIGKRADVYVESSRIAVEVETMYGTGDPIGAKINPKTVKPYFDSKFNGELWLVVPNLHALMYARELLKLRRDYRKEELTLEIYVADLTGSGAELIYGEKRKPGLVKLVDILKFIKKGI